MNDKYYLDIILRDHIEDLFMLSDYPTNHSVLLGFFYLDPYTVHYNTYSMYFQTVF